MFIDYVGGIIIISMIPPDQANVIGLDLGTYGFHRGPEGDTNICKTDNVVAVSFASFFGLSITLEPNLREIFLIFISSVDT